MATRRPHRPSAGVAILTTLLVLGAVVAWWPAPTEGGRGTRPQTGIESDPPGLTPPVPLEAGRSYVETRVLASGDLRVTHWIHSKVRLYDVRLSVPRLGAGLREGLEAPVARRVRIAVDGRPVSGPRSVDDGPRTYPFLGGTSVYVTYVLEDALEASPSSEGRVLARVTNLEVSYRPRAQVRTQVVTGATVQNLACVPPDDDAAPVPCGSPRDDDGTTVWQVRLRGDRVRDQIQAQMDLA